MTGDDLIGTSSPAPRQLEMALASWQSWDYYHNQPYPSHAFGPQQWPRDKGPIPTALPYTEILINEGAEFVFRGGAPSFTVVDNPIANGLIQDIIKWNRLGELWIPLGVDAGNQGALAAKWSIDKEDEMCPIRISFLSIPQECRVWIDPHRRTRLLMARIQYPFRDPVDGQWYYFREEWTDTSHVTYIPKKAGKANISNPMLLSGYQNSLGDSEDWEVEDIEDNPFGVVPVTVIRNQATKGNPLGEGDCWRTFRLMDRIALTMHGEDKSSQLHSEPIPVAKNAQIDNEGPLLPGEPVSIRSDNPDIAADMVLLEPHGRARQYTHMTIDKWEDLLYKAVGLSRVNTENVTNKGNMTALAFAITFARTISTSDRKRELWGNSGMGICFRDILRSLINMGNFKEVAGLKEGDILIDVKWPPYFEQTDADKQSLTTRTIDQLNSGLVPPERAVERVARAENISPNEIESIKKELKRAAPRTRKASDGSTNRPSPDAAELANIAATSGVNNFTA